MEFRLIYEGPLKATTCDNSRMKEKHLIRKELHTQLARLIRHLNMRRPVGGTSRAPADRGPHGNRLFLPKDRIIYRVVCVYVMYVQHYVSGG
jgi:hypothetical protein